MTILFILMWNMITLNISENKQLLTTNEYEYVEQTHINTKSSQVKIGEIEFYGLSVKGVYSKIEDWNLHGESEFHPDKLDIVFQIQNNGKTPVNLVLSGIGDFCVASYSWVDKQPSNLKLDDILKDVPWTERRIVGKTLIKNLQPGESRKVCLKGFNIRRTMRKYLTTKNDLWPWKFRVSITAKSLQGHKLSQSQSLLTLTPVD